MTRTFAKHRKTPVCRRPGIGRFFVATMSLRATDRTCDATLAGECGRSETKAFFFQTVDLNPVTPFHAARLAKAPPHNCSRQAAPTGDY